MANSGNDKGEQAGQVGVHGLLFFDNLISLVLKRFVRILVRRLFFVLFCGIANMKRYAAARINTTANTSPKNSIAGRIES
jgi:hypothetical protein